MILLDSSWGPAQWIAISSLFVLLISGLVGFAYRSGKIVKTLEDLQPSINKIPEMESKVNAMWHRFDDFIDNAFTQRNSPRVLNAKGLKILYESQIDTVIKEKFTHIISKIKNEKPSNAYIAEQVIIETIKNLVNDFPELKNKIEQCAYRSGIPVSSLLFVGALNVRDNILKELGLLPEDIDKHKPS